MDLHQLVIDGLGELLVRILLIVPFVAALFILRGILGWLFIRPLRRYAERTPTQWDNLVLDVLDAPVRYLIFTAALYVTLRLLLPNATAFADHLTRTLVVLIVFVALFNAVGF